MKYYYVNTDSRVREDVKTYDIWFERKCAFAGDYAHEKLKHSKLFERLEKGDVIFAYHSGLGYVGVGSVDELKWDQKVHEKSDRWLYTGELLYEYRIRVRWLHDWRSSPKPAAKIGLPVTMYYYCVIDPAKYKAKELLVKLSKGKP